MFQQLRLMTRSAGSGTALKPRPETVSPKLSRSASLLEPRRILVERSLPMPSGQGAARVIDVCKFGLAVGRPAKAGDFAGVQRGQGARSRSRSPASAHWSPPKSFKEHADEIFRRAIHLHKRPAQQVRYPAASTKRDTPARSGLAPFQAQARELDWPMP